jgi:hypothetical protein
MLRDRMNPLKAKPDERRTELKRIRSAETVRLEHNRDRITQHLAQSMAAVPQLVADCLAIDGWSPAATEQLQEVGRTSAAGTLSADVLRSALRTLTQSSAPQASGIAPLRASTQLMLDMLEQRDRIERKLTSWTQRLMPAGLRARTDPTEV